MLRFLWIAFREYWTTWVTGTGVVGFVLWLINYYYDRVRRERMNLRTNLMILFCAFWFLGTFSAWHDADKNLSLVIQQRAEDTGNLGMCRSDLKYQSQLTNLYQQQGASTQDTVNSLQATLGSCVTGSMEKLREKTQNVLIASKLITPNLQKAAHVQDLLVMTNQPAAVDFRLHCNVEIVDVSAGLVNTTSMFTGRPGGRVSAHDWDISIGAPVMAPANPLDIVVYYNDAEDLSCTLSKNY
jgi:hypothetical protein